MVDGADDTPWHLLTRHLSGVASATEEAELQRWIEADPSREQFVRALKGAWQISGALPERHDASLAWQRVASRIGEPRRRTAWWPHPLVRIAAVLVAAVGLTGILWGPVRHAIAKLGTTPSAPAAIALREASTQRGQRATVLLSDGSRVTLDAATTIRYPLTFTAGARRELYLDGEAYFEVAHDSLHPFIVHTRSAETRVLGTKFVVRAYGTDTGVEVAVREGKVALSAALDRTLIGDTSRGPGAVRAAVLTHGQVGRLPSGGEAAVVIGADAERYLAWTDGGLVFRDTPLRDVLGDLSRWYDLDVRFAPGSEPELADRRFTGSFVNPKADDVLTFLALSTDVHVKRNGRTITVAPNRRGR